MSTNEYVILSTPDHPFYDLLKEGPYHFYDLKKNDPMDTKDFRYAKPEAVFDFTVLKHEKKERLLKTLTLQYKSPIISDFSSTWGDYFIEKFPQIQGAMAGEFWSPKNKIEAYALNEEVKKHIENILSPTDLSPHFVPNPGHGFTYPRTISLLINEAYLALEDELASAEDLDTAMKFGVNYPLGLLDWSEKIGQNHIVDLLDDLHDKTKQARYRASTLLRKRALLVKEA